MSQNVFQQLLQDEIKRRMGSEDEKETDPVKLLKKQAAERILSNVGTRADSSLVGYKVSDLSPGPKEEEKNKANKKKAEKKIADKKKSSKIKLEEKIVEIANKGDNFDDLTTEEQDLIDSIPPDSLDAYRERVLQRQLNELNIDSSKVKSSGTKPKKKELGFFERNKRKSDIRRIINRADYRAAKDNPQLQAEIMKAELAKKGYSEEEIIEIIKGL